jgi:hypothetical protein
VLAALLDYRATDLRVRKYQRRGHRPRRRSKTAIAVLINGLSDDFRAVQITRKAIDLLSPPPTAKYDYVVHHGKRLFVIEVKKSVAEISLGGKVYARVGERTTLKLVGPVKAIRDAGIARLSKELADDRKSCTAARAKLLDHYESVLRILDDLSTLLYPNGFERPDRQC